MSHHGHNNQKREEARAGGLVFVRAYGRWRNGHYEVVREHTRRPPSH